MVPEAADSFLVSFSLQKLRACLRGVHPPVDARFPDPQVEGPLRSPPTCPPNLEPDRGVLEDHFRFNWTPR